jgi:hypothetical protein
MITAYQATGGGVTLKNNTSPTLCVQLKLPDPGHYVVFGSLVITNLTASALAVTALLTTNDGAAKWAEVDVTLPPMPPNIAPDAGSCISLQSTLLLPAGNANEIVDIRCNAADAPSGSDFALVTKASLIAISVDAFG